ncbi:MAG: arginine--tRNA ligase [Rhizobiaceae bacterium]|jgi:arginyl-tRNA synthetase|nr:arginine--tRNA ligase [Rhizobiaceae bacterium]
MDIFHLFRGRIEAAVHASGLGASLADGVIDRVTVEAPRDPSHGDIATNAALILAKPAGLAPRDVAEKLATALKADSDVEAVDVAGPGFVNLRLARAFWHRQLADMLAAGPQYGSGVVTRPRAINVEYVSANPTGPMHVGHCRGAVVGDALANLLAFAGHKVTKEYYINDAGAQVDVLAQSALLRYREALGEDIGEIPAGFYPGDYLKPVGAALAHSYGEKLKTMHKDASLAIARKVAVDMMMEMIRGDLAALNVRQDVFFSERQLHAEDARKIRDTINDLTMKGHVYRGALPPPKGEIPEDWEPREQTLFRSTAVGDDMDRPLMKSDGSYTYFASDVAYFKDKHDRGFEQMVFILGADHGGYVKRLEAVARAIAGDAAQIDVLLCQLVKLYRNGEPVRMSKRAGEFVTLRDVVAEVGRDAVRFMMLYRKAEAPLDFDFAKVTEQSKDNPVFYVQYGAARTHSVFRQAAEVLGDVDARLGDALPLDVLAHPSEIDLIRLLAQWPRIVEAASRAMEPHRVAFYLYEVASAFHAHWNKGNDDPALRFIKHDDANLTLARMGLVKAVSNVLNAGLAIVGAEAPTEMR